MTWGSPASPRWRPRGRPRRTPRRRSALGRPRGSRRRWRAPPPRSRRRGGGAGEAVAEEDVVAEHEGAGLARGEILADEEGLGETVRRGLLGVGERDAEVGTVAQQTLEVGQVRRRRDDEDVADTRHHEDGKRVVDDGLVVDRQQLLAGHERERVQARARSAREDDAFHETIPPKQGASSGIDISGTSELMQNRDYICT